MQFIHWLSIGQTPYFLQIIDGLNFVNSKESNPDFQLDLDLVQ